MYQNKDYSMRRCWITHKYNSIIRLLITNGNNNNKNPKVVNCKSYEAPSLKEALILEQEVD